MQILLRGLYSRIDNEVFKAWSLVFKITSKLSGAWTGVFKINKKIVSVISLKTSPAQVRSLRGLTFRVGESFILETKKERKEEGKVQFSPQFLGLICKNAR